MYTIDEERFETAEDTAQLVFTKKGITVMGNYEKISDARDRLDLGRCGDEITYYDSGHITDIYMELADNNTSIYHYDIRRYLVDNIDDVNNWILENGYPGDLYKAAQGAEFESIYMELLEDSDDILLYWAYTYMLDNYRAELEKIEELDDHYIWSNLALDADRLESIGEQVDDLVMTLLDELEQEEQE